MNITSIIITETPDGETLYFESDIVRYVSDGMIITNFEKNDRYRTRLLQVAKMRSTAHPTDFYPLLFDDGQFKIITK